MALLFLRAPLAAAGICDFVDGNGTSKPGSCWANSAFGELTTTQKDCEDSRSQNLYKRYQCGPSEGESAPSGGDCASSAGCLGAGAGAQGSGLSGLGQLLGKMRDDSAKLHEYQAHRLDSAVSTLDKWQTRLGTPESRNQGDITGLANDRSLVSRAMSDFAGKGNFSAEDAAKARDPGIRSDLENYAYYKKGENAFQSEITQREKDYQALQAMQAKTLKRESNLGTIQGVGGVVGARDPASAGVAAAASGEKDAEGAQAGKKAGKPSADSTIASASASAGARAGAGAGAAGSAGTGSLRDQLRELLAADHHNRVEREKAAAAEALEGTSFQKELRPASGEESDREHKELLKSMFGNKLPDFTLAGTETDREVKRLLATQDALKSDGVLAAESQSLFQRVRRAHKSCLQRECVTWRFDITSGLLSDDVREKRDK